MKKMLLILLISLQAQAADFTVEFTPANNSVGDAQVSSISSSKISDFVSSVVTAISSTLSNYLLKSEVIENPQNLIINGNFLLNQRNYNGSALSLNTYGYDRWRAVTASTIVSSVTANTSNKIVSISGTLRQTIEDSSIIGGNYTLSWDGTATCKLAEGISPTGGTFGSSPQTLLVTSGAYLSVDCKDGTLGLVQLNKGLKAAEFIQRPKTEELILAKRYYQAFSLRYTYYRHVSMSPNIPIMLPVEMRITPSIMGTTSYHAVSAGTVTEYVFSNITPQSFSDEPHTTDVGIEGVAVRNYYLDAEIY